LVEITETRRADRSLFFRPNAFGHRDRCIAYLDRNGEYEEIYYVDGPKTRAAIDAYELGFTVYRFNAEWWCSIPIAVLEKRGFARLIYYDEFLEIKKKHEWKM
jgi:hypothetical protein